jgi:Mg-chelatase subunit ChlD
MGMAMAHVTEPPPSLRLKRPDLPPAYDQVVQRSLEKDPARRFQTASELARAVAGLQAPEGGPTVMEPASGTVIEGRTPAALSPEYSPPQPPGGRSGETFLNTPPPPVNRKSSAPRWILAGGGLAAVLLVCLVAAVLGAIALDLLPNPLAGSPGLPPTELAANANLPAGETPVGPTDTPELPEPTQFSPVGLDTTYIEYILDASGSMLQTLQGKTRLAIAQDVLTSRLEALPPRTQVGLRVYGHRVPYQQEAESCQDIELVVPIQAGGAEDIITWLPTMQALGMTPMSDSIRQAAEDFTFEPGRKNFIVLISDGEETCGEEPADVVRYLQEIGIDFKIHVIGLDVDEMTQAQLRRIAEVAGGVYHDAKSEADLQAALGAINEAILTAPPPGGEVAQALPTEPAAPPTATQPALPPTATAVPEPNAYISVEGRVEVSSIYDANSGASLTLDGNLSTSWWSAGPGQDGLTTYQWTGERDDFIATIEVISNRENEVIDFRTGYGFEAATVQVLDAQGLVVFEESIELSGTPDPDIFVHPRVTGRSILLIFSGSEALDCGGFAELLIGAVR